MTIPLCLGVQKIRDPLEMPMWPNFEVGTQNEGMKCTKFQHSMQIFVA